MWIDKVPATSAGYYGDRWAFTLNVTLPDGTVKDLGTFISDAAGGSAATYIPQTTGNYTFHMSFPGLTLTGDANNPSYPFSQYGPIMALTNPLVNADVGNVYGPSAAAPLTVTVGTTPASTIPENPLPTNYWQSPVEAFNHNWYVLNGNWLGTSAINFGTSGIYGYQGNVNPYTQPVLTAHVLWTKPVAYGGQMGGPFNGTESSNFYTGMQYQPKFAPIILNGVLFYTNYPDANSDPQGWTAVDMRTGQVLWSKEHNRRSDMRSSGRPSNSDEYGGFSYLCADTIV